MDERSERRSPPPAKGKPRGAALRGEDAGERSDAGRLLGSARSERKTAAARENGRLGGRPRGMTLTGETRQKMAEAARRRWAERKERTS